MNHQQEDREDPQTCHTDLPEVPEGHTVESRTDRILMIINKIQITGHMSSYNKYKRKAKIID